MPCCVPLKLRVSMDLHLNGSFIVLHSFIAPPAPRRIHSQLLLRNGSVQVWDWSLPPSQNFRPQDTIKTSES